VFKTSQQEAFCDAWKSLKSVFGLDFTKTPLEELMTHSHRLPLVVGKGTWASSWYGTANCRTTFESGMETMHFICTTFQATFGTHLALLNT